MHRFVFVLVLTLLAACSQVIPPEASTNPNLQIATNGVKGSGEQIAVSQKLGAVFVVGDTKDALDGPYKGQGDVFLRRYNRDGTLAWRTQIGGAAYDRAAGIALDQNGNVYVSTSKSVDGKPDIGNLYKYNSTGKQLWVRRYTNPDADPRYGDDGSVYPVDIGVDGANNIYVIGNAGDETRAYVGRYSSSGALRFFSQVELESAKGQVNAATVDRSGNVYIATKSSFDGAPDTALAKVSSSGKLLWVQPIYSLVVPSFYDLEVVGNVLYAGGVKEYWYYYDVDEYLSDYDTYIAKYTLDGKKLMGKTLGTSKPELADSLSVDAKGNIYLTGRSFDSLEDTYDREYETTNSIDLGHMFVQKLTSNGDSVWKKQFNPEAEGRLASIAAYGVGELYVTGELGDMLPNGNRNSGVLAARLDGSGKTVWLDQ